MYKLSCCWLQEFYLCSIFTHAAPPCPPAAGTLQHALPTVNNPDCGFPAITAKVRAG